MTDTECIVVEKDNSLIPVDKITPMRVFTEKDELDVILNGIAQKARDFKPCLDTVTSRKEIAAMAYKVAQSKTFLDSAGKKLVEDWKTKAKKVDESRKRARDFLDNLKDEVRKPLSDWEESEKIRIEKEEAEKQYLQDWDEAIKEHELFLRQKAIEAKEAELRRQEELRQEEQRKIEEACIQKEREENLKKEAAEKARREAEEKAKREKEAIEKKLKEEKEAREKAERDRIAAEERAKIEQALAVKKAQEEAERKVEEEKLRIAEEARKQKEKSEKEAANKRHRKAVNELVLQDLLKNGIDKVIAEKIICLVDGGKIQRMSINYYKEG